MLSLIPIPNFPLAQSGDDIAAFILDGLTAAGISAQNGDVLAVAQKIISKAEGRTVQLADITPSDEARRVADITGKDPRLVELILRESDSISRMKQGALIVRHKLGFTSANAGIDRSNVAQKGEDDERVLLLPKNPDASAAQLHEQIKAQTGVPVGIVITDSHGRPFRLGNVGVAIGVAGISALWNRRGETDLFGYALQHTDVAVADEIAAAAGLVMGQGAEGMPVVLMRGLSYLGKGGAAADLIRPRHLDLYR